MKKTLNRLQIVTILAAVRRTASSMTVTARERAVLRTAAKI